jgi:hypothetical protein
MSKETKGIHPEPSEDSLIRVLKKENIKLRSLYEQVISRINKPLIHLSANAPIAATTIEEEE